MEGNGGLEAFAERLRVMPELRLDLHRAEREYCVSLDRPFQFQKKFAIGVEDAIFRHLDVVSSRLDELRDIGFPAALEVNDDELAILQLRNAVRDPTRPQPLGIAMAFGS